MTAVIDPTTDVATVERSTIDATSDKIDWRAVLTEALVLPGRMSDTYTRFYNYSFLNQLWLMAQGVHEPCASFNRWKALGRYPIKGAGRYVLHPRPVKKRNEETGEDEIVAMRFPPKATAFPLSLTHGAELEMPELPEWDWQRAFTALEVEQIPFELLNGNIQGYSVGRMFAINPVAKWPGKTTLHELAHIVLGHTTEGDDEAASPCSRGVAEAQAESVTYLMAHEIGLDEWDPAESRAYIQNWLDGKEVTDQAIKGVFSAVDAILRAGRPVRNFDVAQKAG
ncbi:hypothetical protein B5P44_01640 [Mycobacterium sp. CBMA 213]|nr:MULTISPECIES: hypothetical protein [unclassified Mycolicibacterium]MUL61256.1 hypothetical protein [Mycolicibacterium sp. CBMA 335]MUM03492.1 hypothetical protein [Mycolicibacterium sp. CBMA 213]